MGWRRAVGRATAIPVRAIALRSANAADGGEDLRGMGKTQWEIVFESMRGRRPKYRLHTGPAAYARRRTSNSGLRVWPAKGVADAVL